MAFFRIIFFLLILTPFMLFFSGCYSDSFLDAMKAEEDFIAPFDVTITTEESKRTIYFPITDTGSTTNIIGVSGEDGDYNNMTQPDTLNFEEQDVGGDYIVIDHTTGLTWTKCTAYQVDPDLIPNNGDEYYAMDNTSGCTNIAKSMEWSKAVSTCKNLNHAGHKDWRLPRLPELLTIADYGRQPAINTDIFPENKGDLEVFNYTKRYSVDTRDRYIKETDGSYTKVSFVSLDPPAIPNTQYLDYVTAKYILKDGIYIFNEGYMDRYKENDAGTYVLEYLIFNEIMNYTHYIKVEYPTGTYTFIDYNSKTHYRYDGSNYIVDTTGNFIEHPNAVDYIEVPQWIIDNDEYISISGDYYKISILSNPLLRYNYDPVWGFGYVQSNTGTYIRLFIKNNEDTFYQSGIDYIAGAGPYVRQYIPDLKVTWAWSAFWGDYISSTAPYADGRAKYKFNGTNFIRDDVNGKFIQKFETPFGYWTYTSKLMFDANMNTADHGWIVFFQSGGTFGVNIASFKLKNKEDLTFEKQFVRCVRGGNGDIDDVDY